MVPETFYKSLGQLIRRRRKKLELTQAQLAGRLGISRASLANIETGRQNVLVHNLYRFAEALEIGVRDLLPPEEVEQSPPDDVSGLPLPEGLSSKQKAQIARVLRDPASSQAGTTESEED